jgi:ubiquinone biosynthesis protein UbiJ
MLEADLTPYRLRCETVELHNCLLERVVADMSDELEATRRENARLRQRIEELEAR